MKKKSEFEAPYIGIETIDNTPIFYNRRGDYSVIIKCENPIIQYSADMDAYYDFHHLFTNILKVLGTGYTIQKQDILCKKSFLPPQNRKNDYLSNRYFEHFKGRIYTDISTYLVITGEVERSKFFSFDPRRFDTFIRNITKVLGLFANRGIRAKLLNENEIEIYIKRFLSINFNQQTVSLKNIKAREENLIIGEKNVQCISLVDIDEVNFPSVIKPYKEVNIGLRFPVDLLSFLHDTPGIDTIIYNQVINIPDQRNRINESVDGDFGIFRDETIEADDRAFLMKIEDTVRAAVDEARFNALVQKLRDAKEAPILPAAAPKVVELAAKEFNIRQNESEGILGHLIAGGDLSLYGLANAVTRHAQDVQSYDRSTELEATGYKIITMQPSLLKRWNEEVSIV